MKYGVISGSLNPQSKGNQLAIKAFEYAQKKEMDVTFIEMRD